MIRHIATTLVLACTLTACTLDATTTPHPVRAEETSSNAEAIDLAAPRPHLERVYPDRGCYNTDQRFAVIGFNVSPEARVVLTYPYHEATAYLPLDGILFTAEDDLPWDGMPQSVSGDYTVYVLNPDGFASNRVPLYLERCER